jgi:hypothetical protein
VPTLHAGRELGRSETLAATLRELDLRGNRLEVVPAALGHLRALFVFRIMVGRYKLNAVERERVLEERERKRETHSLQAPGLRYKSNAVVIRSLQAPGLRYTLNPVVTQPIACKRPVSTIALIK